eukprot:Clim_evm54s152 gene=Clim_evmTU54s152
MAVGRLLVVGGSGFVGAGICRAALQRGLNVSSLNRNVPADGQPWKSKVNWIQGNALDPDTYRGAIDGHDTIIHTIGTLFENQGYKKLKRGTFPTPKELLNKDATETFEKINRDTALRVAETALACGSLRTFIFLSAADAAPEPFVDKRYLKTKRDAERGLQELAEPEISNIADQQFRLVILRPSFIYGADNPATVGMAGFGMIANSMINTISGKLPGIRGMWSRVYTPPISAESVVRAALNAAEQEDVSGVYENDEIERLADG